MITRGTSGVLVAADDGAGPASNTSDDTTIATARASDRTFMSESQEGKPCTPWRQLPPIRPFARLAGYDRVAATRSTTAGRGSSTSRFS